MAMAAACSPGRSGTAAGPDATARASHRSGCFIVLYTGRTPSVTSTGRCAVTNTTAPVPVPPMDSGGRQMEQLAVPSRMVDELVEEALVWCSQHGLVVGDRNHPRSGKAPGVGLLHAPFALLPMSFPKVYWDQALELAPLFNELVDRVSLDGEFLQQTLSSTKQVDFFTRRLLVIHSETMKLNINQNTRLGLTRSDYMVDGTTDLLLQVELNTISTSSNGLACGISELHRILLRAHERDLDLDKANVVGNTAIAQHAKALATAWAEYSNQSAVVLVVVQAEERYMYDQYWITVALKQMYGVTTIRKTLAAIEEEGQLRSDGTLMVNGCPVAVVYFRAGYSPNDYPSEAEWRARYLIERSCAIKCPSISYHLAGTKKIQQELAKENVIERFLENTTDVDKVRKCFAGLWSLEDDNILISAIESPELFVLKPQREGGGNNIYGDDLRKTLIRLHKDGRDERAAYILMQRIFPPASPCYLVREGTCTRHNAVSEFGIFGAYLRNKDGIIINDHCGYLMRTKAASLNEGGVVTGYAFLNSIFLM